MIVELQSQLKMASSGKGKSKGFLQKILDENKPIKVDKWDGNAVKNALDDAIRKIYTDNLGYTEKYKYIDIRLAISFAGCAMALFALGFDYFNPFPLSRQVLIGCVLSYFVLMSILTFYTAFIEKNFILFAAEKDKAGLDPDNNWRVAATMHRFDHNYTITVDVEDGKNKEIRFATLNRPVTEWFDEDGNLLVSKFEADVKAQHESLTVDKKNQ